MEGLCLAVCLQERGLSGTGGWSGDSTRTGREKPTLHSSEGESGHAWRLPRVPLPCTPASSIQDKHPGPRFKNNPIRDPAAPARIVCDTGRLAGANYQDGDRCQEAGLNSASALGSPGVSELRWAPNADLDPGSDRQKSARSWYRRVWDLGAGRGLRPVPHSWAVNPLAYYSSP